MVEKISIEKNAQSVNDTGPLTEVKGVIENDLIITPEKTKSHSKKTGVAKIANIAMPKTSTVSTKPELAKNADELSAPQLLRYDYIPDSVYENLPKLLQDSCNIFNDKREKDVFLTGTLAVLGGCYHNVYAYNTVDKKGFTPNLFAFIVAPPASGKGALNYSKKIAETIDREHVAWKILEKRPVALFIIPANISSAGLIQVLDENDGAGVIIESEIDTLANATKQEWGNYSDILRKSFENEAVSLYRKTGKELARIDNCKLSLAISGTPNQFKNVMQSVENGLFSRGCYYVFSNVPEQLKCYGRLNSIKDVDKQFAEFANIANNISCELRKLDNVKILFLEEQLALIQSYLQKEFHEVFKAQDIHANVKRAFPNVLKIATILMCIHAFETKSLVKETACSDLLIKVALELMTVYLRHGYIAYELLPKVVNQSLTINQQRLLKTLPSTFTRAEAIKLGGALDVSTKTVDNSIKVFKQKRIVEALKYGKFKKIEETLP